MERIKRYIELARIFGWFSGYAWQVLFPPFRGYDAGCCWCCKHDEAVAKGKCQRGKEHGYKRCGLNYE